jgi:hypothetical protein
VNAAAPLASICQCGAEGSCETDGWVRFFGQDICPSCWRKQKEAEAANRERHFREKQEAQKAWRAQNAEVADCAKCSRKNLRVRLPRDGRQVGDGTLYITYWHKSPETGTDCRSEVDTENVRIANRAERSWRRKQTSPSKGDQVT